MQCQEVDLSEEACRQASQEAELRLESEAKKSALQVCARRARF